VKSNGEYKTLDVILLDGTTPIKKKIKTPSEDSIKKKSMKRKYTDRGNPDCYPIEDGGLIRNKLIKQQNKKSKDNIDNKTFPNDNSNEDDEPISARVNAFPSNWLKCTIDSDLVDDDNNDDDDDDIVVDDDYLVWVVDTDMTPLLESKEGSCS